MRTLLIDNHDGSTFNVFHLLAEVNRHEPLVVRNDEITWHEAAALGADNIVISPGPGRPDRYRDLGISADALLYAEVPVLGIGLGHQALAHLTGGAVGPVADVLHGRVSRIVHHGRGLFHVFPRKFRAVRCHSLRVSRVPPGLRIVASTRDGLVMAVEHRSRPVWGVQFRPESVGTEHGAALMENFRATTAALCSGVRRRPTLAASASAPRRRRHQIAVHHRTVGAWAEPDAVSARSTPSTRTRFGSTAPVPATTAIPTSAAQTGRSGTSCAIARARANSQSTVPASARSRCSTMSSGGCASCARRRLRSRST